MGIVEEAKGTDSSEKPNVNDELSVHQQRPCNKKWLWWLLWLELSIYAFFILSGQSAATILGRLYFAKGGKSKWLATLVQTAGFPIVIPFLIFFSPQTNNSPITSSSPSPLTLSAIYVFIGLFLAGICMLYSIGLQYLPVSTFSLICASQLGFNAFFSFFLNSLKFTPYIINSVVLLTVSSILLVFQTESSSAGKSIEHQSSKYVIGFLCTVAGAAGYALLLSLTQLLFRKVLKIETFRRVLDMMIFQALVASSAIMVGLFASGDWKKLKEEMVEFELGKSSYVLTLVWTAVTWQIFNVGLLGLIFKFSSLFANVISTVGLPIVPVLAVIFFHEKMNGIKVVALLLAIWGFVSYIYQHYLDNFKSKDVENVNEGSEISLVERV